ncbi:hypothetical protein MP228_004235 [Amoeboaphelidium protococcarum]|nr:hypothetical protein MP228_004235 [Amoeboaphelidium protococcarum]
MNLPLLNPFDLDYPEAIENVIEDGSVCMVKFNGDGDYMAAGCTDGRVLLIDFYLKRIVRCMVGHIRAITSLEWMYMSSDGDEFHAGNSNDTTDSGFRGGDWERLLTCSQDWSIICWDVESGDQMFRIPLNSSILQCQIHPLVNNQILVSYDHASPQLMHLQFRDGKYHVSSYQTLITTQIQSDQTNKKASDGGRAIFIRNGQQIVYCHGKGNLSIIDGSSLEMINTTQISSSVARQLLVSKDGKYMSVISNDRALRLFEIAGDEVALRPVLKLQDLVNKLQWTSAQFSNDMEYIVTGANQNHNLYCWDRANGNIVKILEGPKDSVQSLSWHPTLPIIASVSQKGHVYIWTKPQTQNWSAFAPHFKELETNTEYEEREDEFDIIIPQEIPQK